MQSRLKRGLMIALAALMMVAAVSETAFASDPLDMVREANARYDAGDFRDALRLYRTAYDELDDERLLYRIGLSYENMGNYKRARQFLEKYLEEDPESPVRGRVEATIEQVTALENAIQSYLMVESEPSGAEVFLNGYQGEAEGISPTTIPVASGETEVMLIFPEGQRLEVVVDVGSGMTEERHFSIGTASRPQDDPEEEDSDELASAEDVVVDDEEDTDVVDEDEFSDEELGEDDEESTELAEDVILDPEGETEGRQRIRLDYVDAGPPWWATTIGIIGIAAGNLLLATAVYQQYEVGLDGATWGTVGVVSSIGVFGGIYMLGRNWRSRMPAIDEASALKPPSGARPAQAADFMVRWSTTF